MRSLNGFAAILMLFSAGIALAVLPNPNDGWVDASVITVSTSGALAGAGGNNLINGSGLTAELTLNKDATDTQNWLCYIEDGRWLSPRPPYIANTSPSGLHGDGWVQFEFGTSQQISQMWVWNYNNANYLSRGWRSVAVDYSSDGTTWMRLGGNFLTFAQAPGVDGYACNNKLDFGGISIKKIVLTLQFAGGNYGDPSWAGLSEVLFRKPVFHAENPSPADGAVLATETKLSWTASAPAVWHDVYLGTNQTAVTTATRANPQGTLVSQAQTETSYALGVLMPGTTYYWRVDEVGSDGVTIWPGLVWRFTTLAEDNDGWIDSGDISVSVSSEVWDMPGSKTMDGSGLSPDLLHSNAWTALWTSDRQIGGNVPSPSGSTGAAWIAYTFDAVYELQQMWVWNYNPPASAQTGRGFKNVTIDYSVNGVSWTRLMDGANNYFVFSKAPGESGYACDIKIAFGGAAAKYVVLTAQNNYGYDEYNGLSEMRFKIPISHATLPRPEDAAIDVSPDSVVLSWLAGDLSAIYAVYLGEDSAAVQNASPLYGDLNGTGDIDVMDLQMFAEQWLDDFAGASAAAWTDFDNDGYINNMDFSIIANHWLLAGDGVYRGHYWPVEFTYNAGDLELGKTYYWRVDQMDNGVALPGNVWSFSTIDANLAKPPYAIVLPSSQIESASYEVENVIDGNAGTFWVSNYSTYPNWIEVRWSQPVSVNKVVIAEKLGYGSATYRIDVFNAANAWQTVVGPKTNSSPGQTITEIFEWVEATKIRFYAITPYSGATQSAITSMEVFGTADWVRACKSELPPFIANPAAFPAVSDKADFECTGFSTVPAEVVPGGQIQLNLQLRKITSDTADYGFQIRVGELAVNAQYFEFGNYADYTVALSAVNPQTPTSRWVIGQDYPISVNVYIPEWAPHGDIPVIVTPLQVDAHGTMTNLTNNIAGTLKIQRFETDPEPWPTATPQSSIVIENDQANLYVDGNLIQPYIMTTPDYTTFQSMGEQRVPGCRLWRVLTTKLVDASYGTPEGDAENAECFAEIDQKINNLLRIDPDAYILPVFGIRASDAWTARWPDDATLLSNGTRMAYSLSSARWANQLDYDYRALVAHLMSQSYSGHVIGVQFEIAKETQYWGCWENTSGTPRDNVILGDYSASHITAFRAWLRTKYNNNASALRSAWKDAVVTFDTAAPDPVILRRMDSTLMFKDPNLTKMPMDYWQFHSEAMANMAIVAARAVKEASGGKYITGLWGFYSHGVYATGTEPGKLIHMGHMALQTALASPYIDYLTMLHSYAHRQWGEPTLAYQQRESIRRHGKMTIIELDMRTFFTPIVFNDRTFSEPETLSVLYANIWGAALHGDALWWVGFSAGATHSNRTSVPWFASESINAAMVNSLRWYDAIRTTSSPSTAEIAVFINNADIYAMDAYDGYKPQVSAQYQTILYELTKLGSPVDFYELNDITLPSMSQYKVFLFLSAYNLTTAQRTAIKAVVRQPGKTAVWLYGAGYNNGSTNSAANIQDLTGITTEVTLERRLPTVNFLSGHTLTANIPAGYTLQPHKWEHDPNPYTIGPIFNVNDAGAESLGVYAHNSKVAYAAKTVSDGRSIFMAIPYMSSVVLRDICRVAGVFLYSQNDLYLDADQHFILITNGSVPFNGVIALPQSSQVYDLWNQTIVGSGTSFTAGIPAYVSRMYFYGTAEEVAAFRTKAE